MKQYIVVGSHAALASRIIRKRKPLDTDIFATEIGVDQWMKDNQFIAARFEQTPKGYILWEMDGRILEVELAGLSENTAQIFTRMQEDSMDGIHASPEWLYFLKMSHRYLKDSPHFSKTMRDILDMRARGVGMPEEAYSLFVEREKLTYTYKHPKLNVDKDDFFKGDQVPYKYDHDSIHRVVAIDDEPAYTKYMVDGEQVLCSKDKFFSVSERVRLLGGLEESLVLAAERSLIPHDFRPNPHHMFVFALQKVCTSITSGWFREYCWEHYHDIIKLYDQECLKPAWYRKLRKAIDNNELLPYNGNTY